MEFDIPQRLFDLGVAVVLVSLVAVLLYVGWNNFWSAYEKYVLSPRREREKQAQLRKEREAAARAGEQEAMDVLEPAGYTFEARHQEALIQVSINGKEENYKVKADLIVKKKDSGAKYVAEVKTGSLVTSARHGPTRRQLLEYSLVYPVKGVLLVDMKARKVHHVQFLNYKIDPKPRLDRQAILFTLLAGFVIGVGASILFARAIMPYYVDSIPRPAHLAPHASAEP